MIFARWFCRMFRDIVLLGVVNRSFWLSFALIAFFIIGLTIVAAQLASPFIYTLF